MGAEAAKCLWVVAALPGEWLSGIADQFKTVVVGPEQAISELPPDLVLVAATEADCANAASIASRYGAVLFVGLQDCYPPPRELPAPVTVLCPSERAAAAAMRQGWRPADVVTLAMPVDREVFRPEGEIADQQTGFPRLLCVAGAGSIGLQEFLRAAGASNLLSLRVVVAGAPAPSEGEFESTEASGPQLAPWYRWADAVVVLDDESGTRTVEALASGRPCIVPRDTPWADSVLDRWNGLLVDPRSEAAWAAMFRDLADPALLPRLAAAARTASEPYDSNLLVRRAAALVDFSLADSRPLVSVVLPTYRRGGLIEAAVLNVLAQDYQNLELIVVNDGSPDDTRSVLEKLERRLSDPRLRIVHRENGGLPSALNTGFAVATGEYWTWTSDDNAYQPGALTSMVRELEIAPEVGMVYADMKVTDEHGRSRVSRMGSAEELDDKSCIGACFLYRASVARALGEYDPALRLVEDYDFWLRMRKRANLLHMHRVLYDYADAPDSLTRHHMLDVQVKVLELQQREFGALPDWEERRFRQLERFSVMRKQQGLWAAAVQVALQAWWARPLSRSGWWALLRALMPRLILKWTRKLRGLDAG